MSNKTIVKHLFFVFILFLQFSCGNGSGSEATKCAYGKPVAIFNDQLPGVLQHQFSVNGQDGLETLQFENDLNLEVLQSGCDSIRQEFRFRIPGVPSEDSDSFWVAQAVDYFHFLGNLSDQHSLYHQYAKALGQVSSEIKLAKPTSLGDGFMVKIDRISGSDNTLLQIELGR